MKAQEILRQPALIIDLIYTNQNRPLNITKIAKNLKLWHGNAAKILEKLERGGFILKTKEGKMTTISLTNKGRELGWRINSVKQKLSI